MDNINELFGPGVAENAEQLPASLPPEVEVGNVEYKLKLVNPSASRFEHLVTQMKWRLQEGHGEAIYDIGVKDSGLLAGLTDEDLVASLDTLARMAQRLGASNTVIRTREVDTEPNEPRKQAAEVLVRKVPDDQQFIDLRLAVLGNVDCGKSTLLGVLTQGELDNGHGRARLNLFRHLHEIQTGRTSSISHEILGFNSEGEVVNYSDSRTAEEICETSTKLITLIDLAGHHKYLKTTIFGLTGYLPDFAMLVISANTGIAGTTKEHLGFALHLQVPIFVVINKVDMCSPGQSNKLTKTLGQVERLLKSPGVNKVPVRVECEDDVSMAAINFNSESMVPIFSISCVTGNNIDLLTKFLNVLPPLDSMKERTRLMQEPSEYQVDEVYCVPEVGVVVGGTVRSGSINEGETLLAGPTDEGLFLPVVARSVQRNRYPCRIVQAGQAATLALGELDVPVRKGMVLVGLDTAPVSCRSFEADVYLLYHSNNKGIQEGFQCTVHIGNVCQTAVIRKMDRESLKTHGKARVTFSFIKQPEFIRTSSRVIFRESRTKGMGEVCHIYPVEHIDT